VERQMTQTGISISNDRNYRVGHVI
jgi:hypothetical protein